MERDTLEAMLAGAAGIDRDGDRYTVADGYRLSVYVGKPGRAMEVAEVLDLELRERFCEFKSSEHSASYYLEYKSLHGLVVRPPAGGGGRRAGFS